MPAMLSPAQVLRLPYDASLTLAGNTILAQLGFAVSCGIALAAFVMAMFFAPSVTALMGPRAGWPGHGDQEGPRVRAAGHERGPRTPVH